MKLSEFLKPFLSHFKKENIDMSKSNLSDADFVKKCLECKSYDELALATGLKSPQTRANKLRKAGVNIPTYERAKKVIDVAGLNALIPPAK